MMNYAIAGGALMGASQINESQLDRIVRIVTQFFSPLWSK